MAGLHARVTYWRQYIAQSVYVWGWKRCFLRFMLLLVLVSLMAALWVTLRGWSGLDSEAAHLLVQQDMLMLLFSYTVLFFIINTATATVYMLISGALLHWLGRGAGLPPLTVLQSYQLALVSGAAPLGMLLFFAGVTDLSSLMVALALAAHGAIIHYSELAPPVSADGEDSAG